MEALYINIATKLEKIKKGEEEETPSWIGKFDDIKQISFLRAVFAEFWSMALFVCIAVSSSIDLPDDGSKYVKVSGARYHVM